ncbi:MAG: transposase [Caldilineaceae bacterium]|nr:transposase [Caldilineaceae bacterium]
MPNTPKPAAHTPEPVHRTVRLRLYPGDAETGNTRAGIAGACRFAWNHTLADCEQRYARWREMHVPVLNWPEVRDGSTEWGKAMCKRIGPAPSTSYFTLGQRFTALRNDPAHAWLREYPFECVRYSLKYLADAYKRFTANPKTEGKPRFKARHRTVPAFTIPCKVRIREGRLRIPKVGWLRLDGSNPYADCKPLTVRIRREVSDPYPKWYAYVCYEVPAERTRQPAADGALGLDRNVGQATDSDGVVYAMPDTERLDAQIARKQRELSRKQGWGPKDRRPKSNRGRRVNRQLSKLHRKRRRQRDDATHQVSRTLADTAHTVAIEDLNTKGMTASAKGTVEQPGRNVKQKAGLNRRILASGWGGLELKLAYKAGEVIKVNPAYTSQTCSRCGYVHKANRLSQAVFRCGVCGFRANADHDAAINILVRAEGPPAPVHGPRGRGCCTARGDPVGNSYDL